MSNGHAEHALAMKEGSQKAREDYAVGVNENPFTDSDRNFAYREVQKKLRERDECIREDDQTQCCFRHDRHLLGRANRYQWGIGNCALRDCQERAEDARFENAKAAGEDYEKRPYSVSGLGF